MNILFAITGIAFALFVAFLFSFDRVIYDEHNDWFNNLNCIRLIF